MNVRKLLTGLTVTAGTLFSVPAFAQGWTGAPLAVAVPPGPVAVAVPPAPVTVAVPAQAFGVPVDPSMRPMYPTTGPYRPGWGPGMRPAPRPFNDSAFFAARTRARLDQIGAQLRMQVAQQLVHRRAFAFFMYQRATIEAQLAQAHADGFIDFAERRGITMQVEHAAQISQQIRTDRSPRFGWR